MFLLYYTVSLDCLFSVAGFIYILIDSSTKVYRRSTSSGSKFDVMEMKPGRGQIMHDNCCLHYLYYRHLYTLSSLLES